MTSTVKTVAIVAGVGIGVFVLVKMLAPKMMTPPSKAKSNTDLVSVQGLLSAGTFLGGLFSSGGSAAGARQAPYEYLPGGAYSSTEGISGNELADHAVYGPEYRP